MEKTVLFRDFEERDIDFIYKCKNDEKLNSMIVGPYHPFTYEEATKWVHGCMGEHDTFKFWAICTNDDEKRIVGWVSISKIDYHNMKTCFHGIVIGDKEFNNGVAWIESSLFIYEYVFNILKLNRLYGSSLVDNKLSVCMNYGMLEKVEGIERQSIYKDGKYEDVMYGAILKNDYEKYKSAGMFEYDEIIKRLLFANKEYKKNHELNLNHLF